jgi:hypothetical protein
MIPPATGARLSVAPKTVTSCSRTNLREFEAEAVLSFAPEAALSFVQTVQGNMEGFTKREVEEARKAHEAQAMLGHPTDRNFLGMVRGGMISNCPVTANAVKNAHQIFGPDLAGIRGRTVRRPPVDKHRCQLGHYDRSALAGIYVYLQKCITGSTVSAYGDMTHKPPPPLPHIRARAYVWSPRLGAEPSPHGRGLVSRSQRVTLYVLSRQWRRDSNLVLRFCR